MESFIKKLISTWWGKIIIIGLTFALILFLSFTFYVVSIIKNGPDPNYKLPKIEMSAERKMMIEGIDNPWIGTSNPQITIVKFSDFACHYCHSAFPKIREISKLYQGKIKIIFRDYPATAEHSVNLALAARCVNEQGLYRVMYDKLFINQGISTKDEIFTIAQQTGVDMAKFQTCYNSNKYLAHIDQDVKDATALGIQGTPTWFINGTMIGGDIPFDTFIKIIEETLK